MVAFRSAEVNQFEGFREAKDDFGIVFDQNRYRRTAAGGVADVAMPRRRPRISLNW